MRGTLASLALLAITSLAQAAAEPYVGIRAVALPPAVRAQIAEVVADDTGLLVTHVVPDSPAATAGLQRYDVLVAIGTHPTAEPGDVDRLVAQQPIGARFDLTLVRGGKSIALTVTTASRPNEAPEGDTHELQRAALPFSDRQPTSKSETSRRGATLAVGPIGERSILLTTRDGRTFNATVTAGDSKWSWSIPRTTEPEKPVPATHTARVAALIEGLEDDRSRGVFRFRVQPRANGDERSVVLLVQQRVTNGEYRVLEVERPIAGDELPVNELLAVDSLDGELDRLAPVVRAKLEAALRRYRVPPVKASVRRTQ